MAAFELLISQARRHCLFTKPFSQIPLLRSPLPPFLRPSFPNRFLSSSSSSSSLPELNPPSQEEPTPTTPIPTIQPVSYAVKPKDHPSSPPEDHPHSQSTSPPTPTINVSEKNPEARAWTREDIRYMKDVTKISPVSYPSRVAPLPEDRVVAAAVEEEKKVGDEQLERETKIIEANNTNRRVRWGGFRVVEEEVKLPFPTLIKQEHKKEQKVLYDLQEAIRLVKANAKANFNETVEVHVNLAAELRRTDLKLDGIATLPHGTGKAAKIAVFAEGSAAEEARAAGASVVGGVELVEEIKNGKIKADFDICLTTHQFVKNLQKVGSVLKSRMPSAKAGTVTDDVGKAVREAKRYVKLNKKDKAAVVHAGIGKVSFSEEALRENVGAFVSALLLAKPVGLKKSSRFAGYVNSVHMCSTMGPGFPVSIQSLSIAADRHNRLQVN